MRTAGGTYSAATVVTLGKLATNANVKNLTLDPVGITFPKGFDARLKRLGDNLVLRVDKLGGVIILR